MIEIPFSELPKGEEVLGIRGQEKAQLQPWLMLAMEY